MTNNELKDALRAADAVLIVYKIMMEPVLEELATRAVKAGFNNHTVELGCWESGINTVCFHEKDKEEHTPDDGCLNKTPGMYETYDAINKEFFDDLRHVSLTFN